MPLNTAITCNYTATNGAFELANTESSGKDLPLTPGIQQTAAKYFKMIVDERIQKQFFPPEVLAEKTVIIVTLNPIGERFEIIFTILGKDPQQHPDTVSAKWAELLSGIPLTASKTAVAPTPRAPAASVPQTSACSVCQVIPVSIPITETMHEQIDSLKSTLRIKNNPSSLKDCLSNYRQLVKFNESLTDLRSLIKTMLMDEKISMVQQLRDKLMAAGVPTLMADAYLIDDEQLSEKLFFHSELASDIATFSLESKSCLDAIVQLQDDMSKMIRLEYNPKGNGGAGHCFFFSCADLTTEKSQTTWLSKIADIISGDSYILQKSWRNKVADHLLQYKFKYEPLVMNRMKTDDFAPKKCTYEQYCAWIRQDGNWGSQPELEAFSEITKRPVIVLQNASGRLPQWSSGINLDFVGEPLIFMNHSASHFEAMIKK